MRDVRWHPSRSRRAGARAALARGAPPGSARRPAAPRRGARAPPAGCSPCRSRATGGAVVPVCEAARFSPVSLYYRVTLEIAPPLAPTRDADTPSRAPAARNGRAARGGTVSGGRTRAGTACASSGAPPVRATSNTARTDRTPESVALIQTAEPHYPTACARRRLLLLNQHPPRRNHYIHTHI